MDEDRWKAADRTMRVYRRARLGQARFFRDVLSDTGLTVPQYTLLAVLDDRGESTMGQLADALGTTMGAVTNLVDKLIYLGHVERERSTEDRRVVKVRLTGGGGDALRSILERIREFTAQILDGMDPEEFRTFIETLEKLVEADPDPGGLPIDRRRGMKLTAPKVSPRVNDEQLEKLRALGYVE